MRAGDIALMSSGLWHCGGANISGCRRTLLVASFARTGEHPAGSTYSLLSELKGKHTVGTLRREPAPGAQSSQDSVALPPDGVALVPQGR